MDSEAWSAAVHEIKGLMCTGIRVGTCLGVGLQGVGWGGEEPYS